MGMTANLDRVAVRRGALGVLMFVGPAYVFAKILSAGSDDSLAWLILVGGLFFGATFGGYAGARDRPPSPISHAALSAASGLSIVLVAALLVQAVQGDLGLAVILFAVVILQTGTALGCLGGLLASKGVRP
jgi:hypothetical protein